MIYIAADGGGSKLLALAFDEELNVLASAKAGGVNSLFMNAEDAEKNMNQVSDDLFSALNSNTGHVDRIGGIYCTIAGSAHAFVKAIERYSDSGKTVCLSEGQIGVFAGTLSDSGLLALSGTGSDCFLVKNGKKTDMIGGWGQYFGDEGSGFYMGREAIVAAIKSFDGRGPKTELEELVFKGLGLNDSLWEVCSLHKRKSFRSDVSSLTKAIEKACTDGDSVAMEIVEKAASEIACAAVTIMKKNGYEKTDSFPFTTSGGAWKTSEKMTDIFVDTVKNVYPNAVFHKPEFEPVVGCVIQYLYEMGKAPQPDLMKKKFRGFLL